MRKLILAAILVLGAAPAWALLPLWQQNNLSPAGVIDRASGAGAIVPSVPFATADIHEPAANTAAVVTYAANNAKHVIGGLSWSYSAAPTGGNLKIENGAGTTVYSVDITAAGPGSIEFPQARRGSSATALIITLAAGGGGITGKLNVTSHWIENP